jgi:hypothetical protein
MKSRIDVLSSEVLAGFSRLVREPPWRLKPRGERASRYSSGHGGIYDDLLER